MQERDASRMRAHADDPMTLQPMPMQSDALILR